MSPTTSRVTTEGWISVRIDPKDRKALKKAADAADRTLAAEIRVAIRAHLKRLAEQKEE